MREEFQKALELDPDCSPACSGLATTYLYDFLYGSPAEREAAGTANFECACKAVELAANALAHADFCVPSSRVREWKWLCSQGRSGICQRL